MQYKTNNKKKNMTTEGKTGCVTRLFNHQKLFKAKARLPAIRRQL